MDHSLTGFNTIDENTNKNHVKIEWPMQILYTFQIREISEFGSFFEIEYLICFMANQ